MNKYFQRHNTNVNNDYNCSVHCIAVLKDNYTWVLKDHAKDVTLVIDPSLSQPLINNLDQLGYKLDGILNTHHHFDHVGANLALKKTYNIRIYGSKKDHKRIPGITDLLQQGDTLQLGSFNFLILELDGHTLGHIGYYETNNHWLFVGDTLFSLGCGRLFEGSAKDMVSSLNKIKKLDKNTLIFCAHEYTLDNAKFVKSLNWKQKELDSYINYIKFLRQKNIPSIPTSLPTQMSLNPFLNTHNKALRESLAELKQFDGFNKIKDFPSATCEDILLYLRTIKETKNY